ncbi:MAG: helix-turn-helix domain-containing protein [Bacillota bacterium]
MATNRLLARPCHTVLDSQDGSRQLGTVKAGALRLNVGEKTVRRLIDAGKLPGICRLGRLIRIDLDILDQWIAEGCPPLYRFSPNKNHTIPGGKNA